MGHVIDFTPDGQVQSMYSDTFNIGFLGKQSIERASEIMFDEHEQTWAIHLVTPKGLVCPCDAKGFDSYEGARQVEVAWLNSARLEGVDPLSGRGRGILEQAIREFYLPRT